MELDNHQIGWKIIRLLNYNLTDALPRTFKVQEIAKTIHSDSKDAKKLIHEIRKKVKAYFFNRTSVNDANLFKTTFDLTLNDNYINLLKLDYQSSIPKESVTLAQQRELFLELNSIWIKLGIKANCQEYISRTLQLMFNEDDKPQDRLSFYSLEVFSSNLCFLLISDGISGFNSLKDFLKNANPLIESLKKDGRTISNQEYNLIFNDPACSEIFRDLIKSGKLKKSG